MKKKQEEEEIVDLTKYAAQPGKYNENVPKNLYLIACAGRRVGVWNTRRISSWTTVQGSKTFLCGRELATSGFLPQRRWKKRILSLPKEFDTVFVDTDHLSACVLTKLALASVKSVVVPLSFDDVDFNRLFQDVTKNALFQDVMIDMDIKNPVESESEENGVHFPRTKRRMKPASALREAFTRRLRPRKRRRRKWTTWRNKCGRRVNTASTSRVSFPASRI